MSVVLALENRGIRRNPSSARANGHSKRFSGSDTADANCNIQPIYKQRERADVWPEQP
jgi:hypothetical protein